MKTIICTSTLVGFIGSILLCIRFVCVWCLVGFFFLVLFLPNASYCSLFSARICSYFQLKKYAICTWYISDNCLRNDGVHVNSNVTKLLKWKKKWLTKHWYSNLLFMHDNIMFNSDISIMLKLVCYFKVNDSIVKYQVKNIEHPFQNN